jgi:DNA gyrase subunit A
LSRGEKIRQLIRIVQGPRFSDGGLHHRPGRHRASLYDRPRIDPDARPVDHRDRQAGRQGVDRLSRRSPTRSTRRICSNSIADLVREKTIGRISDLRDESDREGMRIVVELKRARSPRSFSTTSTSTRSCRPLSASSCSPSSAGGRRC